MRRRKLAFWRIGFLSLFLSLIGCGRGPDSNVPARYGLREAVTGRGIVEQAIVLVDAMLPKDVPLRLRPTWAPSGWFPTLVFEIDARYADFDMEFVTDRGFDNGFRFRNATEIPVFIVDGAMLARVESAFVPDGERCIIVNAKSLEKLFQSFFMTGFASIQEHNSFDKALVLALVFLHELGHLHYGDTGSYGRPARLEISEINRPSAAILNPEVRADRFASEILTRAWASREMRGPIDGPYGRALIASNIFRAIATGSNTHDLRNDPQGILNGVSKPDLFRQAGYSHLNLYLRLLILLEQLEPNEFRLAELRWINDGFASE